MESPGANLERADVVVVGGSLAGASTAWLIVRERPEAKVIVLERTESHGRKVGEATVEISGYFLTRVLGMSQYLLEEHLPKNGLRFWFANAESKCLESCSEIGGRYLVRVPSFQLDRARLDEEVSNRAAAAGVVVRRRATVERVELRAGGNQVVHVREGDRSYRIEARWVVDASGVATLLARQEGWRKPNEAHPTTSAWARWRGVKDWDGLELARRFPGWAAAHYGTRGTATNHLVGPGWWAWMIPLKGGDTSVGVVFDERQVDWPTGGSVAERLKTFLCAHPVGREMLEQAEAVEGDVHWRRQLAYRSEVLAGDGFVLVGDAAGFLDPFYSPGMDWVTFTVMRAKTLVVEALGGAPVPARVEAYNRDFRDAYHRWFTAVYRDKYDYLGDFELLRIAFLLDLGLYYLGVASQPFRRGVAGLLEPPFVTPPSMPVYHFMRLYNRRLAAIGRSRLARGTWGRANAGRRKLVNGFTFEPSSGRPLFSALIEWLALEVREGWRTWFTGTPSGRIGTGAARGGREGERTDAVPRRDAAADAEPVAGGRSPTVPVTRRGD